MIQAAQRRRWLAPMAAGLVVLALIGGVWAALSHTGGPRPAGFAGGGGPSAAPGGPGSPPGPVIPSPGLGSRIASRVAIDSYYAYDARHLAINYTTGVPTCFGHVQKPRVQQGRSTVTVTLVRSIPRVPKGVACVDLAMVRSVRITLAAPLGDRVVRDGTFGDVVHPGTAPNDPTQTE